MLHESLFGRAEVKRTINVEANLLAERSSSRLRVVAQAKRRLIGVAVSVVVCCGTLPFLYRWQAATALQLTSITNKESALAKKLNALSSERDASVPKIADSEMVDIMRRQSDEMIGQLVLMLNSAPKTAVMATLRAEVVGGNLTLNCTAEAANFESMREFLTNAAQGPRAISTVLSSSKHSETLSKDGVAFDFVKKATVGL